MNYTILYDISPKLKCGAALFSGVAGVAAASAISTAGQISTNERNISKQQEENQRQRDFSHDEAEIARNFQRDEWSRQFAAQTEEWYRQYEAQQKAQWDMYQKQAEYNSPKNQVQRLAQAGLNPSAVMNGTASSGLVSAATANQSASQTPSVPSGGPVSVPAASAPSVGSVGLARNPLDGVASLVSALADSNYKSMVAPAEVQKINAMVSLLTNQAVGEDLSNKFKAMSNFVYQRSIPAKVQKAFTEVARDMTAVLVDVSLGKMYDSQTSLNGVTKLLQVAQEKLTSEQFLQLQAITPYVVKSYLANIDNLRSQSANQRAQAALANANKETIDKLREFQVKNEHAISKLNTFFAYEQGIKAGAIKDNKEEYVNAFVANLERADLITKEEKERFTRMSNDNKQYWIRSWLDYFGWLRNMANPMSNAPMMGSYRADDAASNAGMVDFYMNSRPVIKGFAP